VTLHLIKLSVGSESLETLEAWQKERKARSGRLWHRTRMMPKRADEIVAGGGSIYWVIRGVVLGRQRILGFERVIDSEGKPDTWILLDDNLVPVEPRPHRAFQGWRYLKGEEAPSDLGEGGKDLAEMPAEMLAELRNLGLL
jgi:hypothetical protein